jgi:hypothetical protein
VQFIAGLNQALLTPRAALIAGQPYTVTITTGVKDSRGNALAAPFNASFTLKGPTPDQRYLYLPLVRKP